jgi:hypothetical protein
VKAGRYKRSDSNTLTTIVCRRAPTTVLLVRPVLRAAAAPRAFRFVVRAGYRLAGAMGLSRWLGSHEEEPLLVQHQAHHLAHQQTIVVGGAGLQRQYQLPQWQAQVVNRIV